MSTKAFQSVYPDIKTVKDIEIPIPIARDLLKSPGFKEDTKFGLHKGTHYRMPIDKGCVHLRIHDGKAFIHKDRWDPNRYLIRHGIDVLDALRDKESRARTLTKLKELRQERIAKKKISSVTLMSFLNELELIKRNEG